MKTKTLLCLFSSVFFLFILFGCLTSTPSNEFLIELAKNDSIVKLFLEKYPNASIVHTEYSAEIFIIFFSSKNLSLRVEINTDQFITPPTGEVNSLPRGVNHWNLDCGKKEINFRTDDSTRADNEKIKAKIIDYIQEDKCFKD